MQIRKIAIELLLTVTSGMLASPACGQSDMWSSCDELYGASRRALPTLLLKAITVLPQPDFPISSDQVVLIRDINGFLDCNGVNDSSARNTVANYRAMVFNNHF